MTSMLRAGWCLLLTVAMASAVARAEPRVKLGIDVLRESGFAAIAGRRVGLVANPASVDGAMTPTVDVLHKADGVRLVALFGPEHGVWGDEYAGDKVDDKTDPRTGLPVFSLYGATRKPTPEMLDGIDVVVFDLQDIGARSYTYISTMRAVLEACAEQDKALVILDRPNPLGGLRIEGGGVEPSLESFVSYFDVPYLHGMTMGELAGLVRDRYAPGFGKLTVIPMQGWSRATVWDDTGLRWVPTSPHIPTAAAAYAYAATGIAGELGQVSNGVGYTQPFEIIGSPTTDGPTLAAMLQAHFPDAAGVFFRPIRFKPFYATFKGEVCGGVQVHLDPRVAPNLIEINYRLLEAMNAPVLLAAAKDRHNMFDKVSGTSTIRQALEKGDDLQPIFDQWRDHAEAFREARKPYLLYE